MLGKPYFYRFPGSLIKIALKSFTTQLIMQFRNTVETILLAPILKPNQVKEVMIMDGPATIQMVMGILTVVVFEQVLAQDIRIGWVAL